MQWLHVKLNESKNMSNLKLIHDNKTQKLHMYKSILYTA